MGVYNIRLGSKLVFDEQQEADIISALEAMNASHKSGQFISSLIRIAFDCPEIFDRNNGKYEKGAILKAIENTGITYNRQLFINQITKEVDAIRKKVDDMYNIVLNTYMLGKMGKHLGLEEKANNELMAQFIVEKQLKELQDKLGISLTSSVFASNKKQDIEKIADDALEYIIESYSGIVNELKGITQKQVVIEQAVEKKLEERVEVKTEEKKEEAREKEKGDVEVNDDIIDFGNADFSALGNFFGD